MNKIFFSYILFITFYILRKVLSFQVVTISAAEIQFIEENDNQSKI